MLIPPTMSASRPRSWRCHVNEVLRHLQKRGPLLTSANLLSMRITMQTPISLLPLSILTPQVQRFITGIGPEWISKLNEELMSGQVLPDDRSTFAVEIFHKIAWMIGTGYFWRDNYGYISPFTRFVMLQTSAPKIFTCGLADSYNLLKVAVALRLQSHYANHLHSSLHIMPTLWAFFPMNKHYL